MQDLADDLVLGIAGRLSSPLHRLIFIVVMFIVFGFGSVYITVTSIYSIGKAQGEREKTEYIQRVELEKSNINKEEEDYGDEE